MVQDRSQFLDKLENLIRNNARIVLVGMDQVGSTQVHQIRRSLREHGAELFMGKNTIMRIVFHKVAKDIPALESFIPHIKQNVGLVFTNNDASDVIRILAENKVSAPAKVGMLAQLKVVIPAGPTPLEPTKITFLQALNIASRPVRGTLEIVNDTTLLEVGQVVTESESTLLTELGITPFFNSAKAHLVYDEGELVEPSVFEITEEDYQNFFTTAVTRITAAALELKVPATCAMPSIFRNAFKNLQAVAAETDITFSQVEALKEYLANPSAFAAAAPVAAAKSEAAPAAKEESEEEEESEGGFDLFG